MHYSGQESTTLGIEKEFNSISSAYDDVIKTRIPWYQDMLMAKSFYLSSDFKDPCILDLGCGTGNASKMVISKFHDATVHYVDLSKDMLAICKKKFTGNKAYYHNVNMNSLNFKPNSFDIVVSQLAIHHISDVDKYELFCSIYEWLKPNGVISYTDQFRAPNQALEDLYLEERKTLAYKNGLQKKVWLQGIEHYHNHDRHVCLTTQLNWLSEIGFEHIEVTWKRGAYANILATKS